jgi:hypothetical protein
VYLTCIYLVLFLFLSIPLEGELVETLLAILGGVYLFISWSFGMVKTLIPPYFPRFILLEVSHLLFWGLTISSCAYIHGVGFLRICTRGLVTCILWITFYFWKLVMEHSLRINFYLLYLSCTLKGPLCEIF